MVIKKIHRFYIPGEFNDILDFLDRDFHTIKNFPLGYVLVGEHILAVITNGENNTIIIDVVSLVSSSKQEELEKAIKTIKGDSS